MDQFASKRYAQKLSIRYVSGPRNQRNHKVTGNWALVATVQNCPIRGTATQFPLFIEWRPLDCDATFPNDMLWLSGGCQISSSKNRAPPQVEALPMVVIPSHNPTVRKLLSSRRRSGT